MSIRMSRSVLLEQDKRHLNICGDNCKYAVNEILDFIKDEYIREYYRRLELFDEYPEKCDLLNILLKVQDCIKEIEEELDISFKDKLLKK